MPEYIRVPNPGEGNDPNKVYQISNGQIKPIANEAELQQLTGANSVASAFQRVRTVTPDEARSLGVIDFAKAPVNTGVITNGVNSSQQTLASNQQYINDLQKKITDYQTQQTEAAKQASTQSTGLMDKITGLIGQRQEIPTIDPQAEYEKALSKYGFTPEVFTKMNEAVTNLDTINKQIATLDTQEQQELLNNSNRTTSMNFIEGRGNQIMKAYAIKKSGLSAQANAIGTTLEALRGNLTQANQLASQAVNNIVYARQQKVDDLDWALNTYSSLYSVMSTKEQNLWKNVYDSAVNDLNTKKEEATQIMNLMIQYPSGAWPTDISNLTLAEASQIAQGAAAQAQAVETQKSQLEIQQAQLNLQKTKAEIANIGDEKTGTDVTFYDSTMQAIIDAGLSADDAVEAAAQQAKASGVDLSTKQLEKLKQRALGLKKKDVAKPATTNRTAREAGQATGEVAKQLPSAFVETVAKPWNIITSFFGGLFGK